jgi:transcriptional regulator with XRE-family HTH domain
MSLVSENIKFLRKYYHYTQEQLADKINIKRSLLGAYEEGRADPRLSNLLNMARVFDVPVDTIISKDVSGISGSDLFGSNSAEAGKADGLKILSITVNEQNEENIELVPQKASAGYLNGYADPEYLEELPKFKLPILSKNATYRAFEISGDSMLPIQPGSIIIGQYLESVEQITNGKTYILVTTREGVVYKRVFNYIAEKGCLFLVSDNKTYTPYEIKAEEVLEIWEARAYLSLHLPGPVAESDMTVEKLASIVLDLQKEVIKLKST